MKENNITVEEGLYYAFFSILLFAKGIGLYDGQFLFKCFLVAAVICWAGKMAASRYCMKEIIGIALFLGLGVITYLKSGEKGILLFAMMLTGMKNIPVKRAFRIGLWTWGVSFFLLTFSSLFHMQDMGYKVHDKLGLGYIFRYGLGYAHPNVLHVSYFIFAVFLVYTWGEKYDWKRFLWLLLGNALVFSYSISYTGVAVVTLYLLTALYAAKKKKLNLAVKAVCMLTYPGCCLLSLWGSVLLKNHEALFRIINKIVNERLRLAQIFLVKENISIFGIKAADIITDSLTMDNAYVYLLITHGIAVFALVSAGYLYLIYVYSKENKAQELAVIVFICFMGIMEPYLFNTSFKNVIFLFLGELFYRKCAGKGKETGLEFWVRRCEMKIAFGTVPAYRGDAPEHRLSYAEKREMRQSFFQGGFQKRKRVLLAAGAAVGILTGVMIGTAGRLQAPEGYIIPRNQTGIIDEEYFYITDNWEEQYPGYEIVGRVEEDTKVNAFGGKIVQVETARGYQNGFLIGSVLAMVLFTGFFAVRLIKERQEI